MINNLKKYMFFISSMCLTCLLFLQPLNVSATTKEDVVSVAREVGMPEDLIQHYINLGEGIEVTSEQCDTAIAKLYQIYGIANSKIEEDFNVNMDNKDEDNSQGSTTTDSTSSFETDETTSSTESTSIESSISTDDFISQSDFINMTYDQKVEYVNSLPEDDRNNFMNNLSTSARNSIIKQLNIDAKTDIVESIVEAGEAMGYNFAVDEISNDKLEISMRDAEGTLIGVTKMGVTIDDTGKNYFLLISLSLLVFVSLFIVIFKLAKSLKE